MSNFRKNLNFRCGNCNRTLEVYLIKKSETDDFEIEGARVKKFENVTKLNVKCRNCGERTSYETDSPIEEINKWKQTSYTWREPLNMTCHCGSYLNVELIIVTTGKMRLTKGKIRYLDGKPEVTVKCNRCNEWAVFVRDEQRLGVNGWKRVERKPRKMLYEVDETYAILDAYRKRRKRH